MGTGAHSEEDRSRWTLEDGLVGLDTRSGPTTDTCIQLASWTASLFFAGSIAYAGRQPDCHPVSCLNLTQHHAESNRQTVSKYCSRQHSSNQNLSSLDQQLKSRSLRSTAQIKILVAIKMSIYTSSTLTKHTRRRRRRRATGHFLSPYSHCPTKERKRIEITIIRRNPLNQLGKKHAKNANVQHRPTRPT